MSTSMEFVEYGVQVAWSHQTLAVVSGGGYVRGAKL